MRGRRQKFLFAVIMNLLTGHHSVLFFHMQAVAWSGINFQAFKNFHW
jgi:hypothetical protein